MRNALSVVVDFDDETFRYYIRATEIPGLRVEGDTYDEIEKSILHWAPELIRENLEVETDDVSIDIKCLHSGTMITVRMPAMASAEPRTFI